jgi:hypothetical protein
MVPEYGDNSFKGWALVSFEPCRVCRDMALVRYYMDGGSWCICDRCLKAIMRRYGVMA